MTRITDLFDDARQPAWSPDGTSIAYLRLSRRRLRPVVDCAGRQRISGKLTTGPFDDREPAWSHDGTRLAFSSDRGGTQPGGNYNIWILDVRSGGAAGR